MFPFRSYTGFTVAGSFVASFVETTNVPAPFDPAVTNKLFPSLSVNPFVVAHVPSL